jgi:hypothetical protein
LLANGTRASAGLEHAYTDGARLLVLDLDGDGWGDVIDDTDVILAHACTR